MKKTLIALAALAAAGAVSAQSAVTLYGRLDLGLSTSNSESTVGTTITDESSTSLFGANDNYSSSRLGVTGTEDLGGGTSAFFNYEMNLEPYGDSSVGTTRLANVGLQGGFGTVTIGTFYNALDGVRSLGNPGSKNFADAFGEESDTSLLGTAAGGATIGDEFDSAGHISGASTRSVSYQLPGMSGFSGQLAVLSESSENISNGKTKSSGGIVGLAYATGPLNVQFAYGNTKSQAPGTTAVTTTTTDSGGDTTTTTTTAAVAATNTENQDWALAASYQIGMATPRVIYERSEGKDKIAANATANGGVAPKRKVSYYAIGSSFDLGQWDPWVTLAYGKLTSNVAAVTQAAEIKQRGYELGISYSMSQRTSLYSYYNSERATLTGGSKVTTDNLAVGVLHTF